MTGKELKSETSPAKALLIQYTTTVLLITLDRSLTNTADRIWCDSARQQQESSINHPIVAAS